MQLIIRDSINLLRSNKPNKSTVTTLCNAHSIAKVKIVHDVSHQRDLWDWERPDCRGIPSANTLKCPHFPVNFDEEKLMWQRNVTLVKILWHDGSSLLQIQTAKVLHGGFARSRTEKARKHSLSGRSFRWWRHGRGQMREDEKKASRGTLRESKTPVRWRSSYCCRLFGTNSATFVRIASNASSGGGTKFVPSASELRFVRFVYCILIINHMEINKCVKAPTANLMRERLAGSI